MDDYDSEDDNDWTTHCSEKKGKICVPQKEGSDGDNEDDEMRKCVDRRRMMKTTIASAEPKKGAARRRRAKFLAETVLMMRN